MGFLQALGSDLEDFKKEILFLDSQVILKQRCIKTNNVFGLRPCGIRCKIEASSLIQPSQVLLVGFVICQLFGKRGQRGEFRPVNLIGHGFLTI